MGYMTFKGHRQLNLTMKKQNVIPMIQFLFFPYAVSPLFACCFDVLQLCAAPLFHDQCF